MAFEKGGRADKLGNRYEGLWVANKMLDILEGSVLSIVIEAVGEDERGAEFWLELNDGKRQAHQCKARNGSKENWSVSDLGSSGVLANLRYQLDRDINHEFVFVSGVPATKLGDICDSARNSNGDPEDFYQHQILSTGKPRKEVFQDFCSMLSLDHTDLISRARAVDYLRRTKIVLFPFHDNNIYTRISYTLTGEALSVAKLLANYAEDNEWFGKSIYQDMLFGYLGKKEIFPKNLAINERIWPRISELVTEFKESIKPLFIRNNLIRRNETEQCLKMLDNKGFVILHGDAGFGKSGVLYELSEKLEEKNIPIFPIRVDKRIPENTTEQYGREIGLPDSPVFCLSAVAGKRSSVVIIDQLDSIRWTSSHSSNALEVCKELVTEVLALRREGHDIKIILSCRTFDLKHDPEIKHWLEKRDESGSDIWGNVEVTNIENAIINSIVGPFYEHLSDKQRILLSNLQNLYIWCELADEGYFNYFTNTLDLLKNYWEYKYQKIERLGIAAAELTEVLDKLVDYMSSNGKNSAPSRLLIRLSQNAVQALKSHSVIQEDASRISFCHQSYLDYLVASKAVEEIESGKDILLWIGSVENQTLFRRDQLKQALNMLLQDRTQFAIDIIRVLINSSEVRFHLKHLILEVITSMAQQEPNIDQLLIELMLDDSWKDYILDLAFKQPALIQLLIISGIINEWLTASSDRQNDAFLLLRFAKDIRPDEVAALLEPFLVMGEEWQKKIVDIIAFDIATDSDRLFQLRIKLAEYRIVPYIINWDSICITYPKRALELIGVLMKLDVPSATQKLRIEKWYDHDMKSLKKMAEAFPELTWDSLVHYVKGFAEYDRYKINKWEREHHEYDVFNGIVKIITYAGQSMAKLMPTMFIEKATPLLNDQSLIVQLILIKCFSHVPKEYSNFGIEWLIGHSCLLETEERLDKVRYKNVGYLIEALSPYCSNEWFEKLESWIINYHEPDELENARHYLEYRKKGYYQHYWGLAQYVLLSKMEMDPIRLSIPSQELLRCLKRKFNEASVNELLDDRRMRGGIIGSKLDKSINKISDSSWIKIISNKTLPIDRGGLNWERIDDDNWVESSIWQFSRTFSTAAKLEPERFGKLALKFPADVHPSYIAAILDSFQLEETDSSIPEEQKEKWSPASFNTILNFLDHYSVTEDNQISRAFCWLLDKREREQWPHEVIKKLVNIALFQSDLEIGELNVHNSDWDHDMNNVSVNDLFTNTINCVKGVAARAIGSILWHHQSMFEIVRPAIESLVNDPHPVVRMSSIASLLPGLNIDRQWAVECFLKVPQTDLRTICSRDANQFISYTAKTNQSELRELFMMMIKSDNIEVATQGAELITACYMFYQLFEDLLQSCINGPVHLKKGVASIASEYISNSDTTFECRQLLMKFLESDDCEELSEEISSMFRFKVLDVPDNRHLIKKYLLSKAFNDRSLFLHQLEEYEGDLLFFSDVIFTVFEAFSKNKDNGSYRFDYRVDNAITLLLRLYDRAKDNNHDIFCRCLDTWDMLFEKRITSAQRIVKFI